MTQVNEKLAIHHPLTNTRTYIQTPTHQHTCTHIQTHTHKHPPTHARTHPHMYTHTHTDRQTHTHTDRQTDTHTDRQTHTHTHTYSDQCFQFGYILFLSGHQFSHNIPDNSETSEELLVHTPMVTALYLFLCLFLLLWCNFNLFFVIWRTSWSRK